MNVEQLVFWGGCLSLGGLFVFVLSVYKIMDTMQQIVRESTPDNESMIRDMFQFTERLWEKMEFSKDASIAQTHASERVERIRSDADVEKTEIQAEASEPETKGQPDLANTGIDPAAFP